MPVKFTDIGSNNASIHSTPRVLNSCFTASSTALATHQELNESMVWLYSHLHYYYCPMQVHSQICRNIYNRLNDDLVLPGLLEVIS